MLTDDEAQTAEPSAEKTVAPKAPKAAKAKKAVEGKPAKAKANGKAKQAAAKPAKATKPAKQPAKAAAKGKAADKQAKPRQRDPDKLDVFGYRKGTTRSQAAALYSTKKGATLAETKEKFGVVQFNVLTEVQKRGHKVTTKDERNGNGRTVKRFFLTASAKAAA